MNQPSTSAKNSDSPLVVAIGASAGGLEAFQELLSSIGDASHMALVFVQHLDSTKKSLLAELLSKSTPLEIVEITGRCRLKASTVYICPPQTLLDLKHGFVSIANEGSDERVASSIDHFFHAVAEDQGERGVGVILSGTGSDGTLGLKAISDRGGMTFAQEPTSAKYDSMPRSAATTGVADHVMTPAEIAAELLQYSRHVIEMEKRGDESQKRIDVKEAIPLIAERLMEVTQHNFQHYKLNTLSRRIQRRMQVLKIATVSDYLDHLQHHEEEVRALFRELLIGVTAFFRDPDMFEALKRNVLPKLFENRTADDCVRIWVAGCANGAEAYTLAILCREVMDELAKPVCEVQIFATDIDERALGVARAGVFPIGIEEQISPERLKRFFVKRGKRYHVTKEIRELVLFSVHNLISDPPFSRQDLISCRNLLIYLGPHLQNKLIPLFHYALRPGGYLCLGPSENITSHGELFRPIDAKQRISQRKGTAIGASGASQYRPSQKGTHQGGQFEPDSGADLTEIRQRITLDEFAPKSVVIDENGQILNASPDMQKYLTVSGGNYQNNIVKMAARGLRLGLRAAIAEARKTQRRIDHEDLSIRIGDQIQRVMVTVQPMPRMGEDEALYMVVFHDIGKPFNREDANGDARRGSLVADGAVDHSRALATFATSTDAMVTQLERELETTRDDLDKTLQDMEAANEELKSSNEELLSMNEELQSANEELETSKEEIRAGSDAIARANADLENLLRSTQIATVFLDDQLLIRSFTPAIEEIYSLISTDVGRPLERFVSDVPNMPPLPDPRSLKDGESVEHTVVARSGKSFIRRVLPYRSHTGASEGIVVTFTDVSELRQSEERFRATFANAAVGIAHVGLDGAWLRVNDRMCEIVGYDRAVLLQKTFQEITHPDDLNHDLAQLQALNSGELDAYTIEKRYFRSEGDVIWIRLTVSAKRDVSGQAEYFISIVEDIDKAKRGEIELANAKARLELSLEVANIAPWNWDMRTGDIVSNPTLNRLFGFAADATPRLSDLVARIDPAAQSRVSAAIDRSIQTGETYDQEYSIHWPSGEVRHIRARGEARMSNTGEMEDFFGVVVDITDRKRRELELADRESHLRRVIDNSVNFIGVLDVDGTLLEANATAIKAGGVTREDVIGKKFWDCYWWSHDESTMNQLREAVERVAEGEVVRYDVTLRMAGDTRMIIDFMLAPVFDKDGRVTHLIPSGFDISDRKAAEATLRESEQLVRTLAENSTQAMIMMDERGYLTYCNQAFLEMVGFDGEEIRSQPLHDLIHHHHPDGRPYPMSDCPIDRALPEDFSVRAHEDLFFRKDGSAFPVMCAASPIFRGGVAVATVIEVRDITEQKRWEKDIAGREAHLRRVINNQLGLVGLIDHNGLLLDIDDRSLKIAGLTRDDVIGKHFAECAWWTHDAAVAQAMRETMDRALAGEVVRYDVPICGGGLSGPDGRLMIDFMLAPVFDSDGNVEFLIPSGVDISERHAAEQALKKTEQNLRIGMEVAKFGVANIDYSTDTVELSKEASALYGLGDREVIVRRSKIYDLVYDEDKAELVRRTKACLRGDDGGQMAYTYRIVLPDGTLRWLDVRKQAFFDDATGAPTHGIMAARDVTQQRQFEQSLQEARQLAVAANESKSAFLANMSHEIRTPMTAILGYADLIREKIDDSEARNYLHTIRRNGDYLLGIINDILDLSKIEAGKFDIELERFEPVKLIEDVLSIMEVRASEGGLVLDVEYDGKIPMIIESDAKRLKQILINLVGNAIKFTKQGGVRICVRYEDRADDGLAAHSTLHFDVTDTGVGMSDEQMTQLFKPFSQGDSSVSRRFGGTGLGLAISRRLAEMLGGKIEFSSALGVGSTFSVSIATGKVSDKQMLEYAKPPATAISVAPAESEPVSLNCRVLVVDDRRDIRFLSKHLLTQAGATVDECADGQLAVEHVMASLGTSNCPDLILLDMQMPNLDGYEAARALRKLGYTGPIIALTADAMQGDMNECLEAGCDGYLSKPTDKAAMLQKIGGLFSGDRNKC